MGNGKHFEKSIYAPFSGPVFFSSEFYYQVKGYTLNSI